MIENITNIGQLLIPANQAASGKAEAPDTKRFSIDGNQNTPERKVSEISSDDNSSRKVNDSGDASKNEYAVDEKSNNKPKSKIENHKTKNQHAEGHEKPSENSDSELHENRREPPAGRPLAGRSRACPHDPIATRALGPVQSLVGPFQDLLGPLRLPVRPGETHAHGDPNPGPAPGRAGPGRGAFRSGPARGLAGRGPPAIRTSASGAAAPPFQAGADEEVGLGQRTA